MKNLSLYDALIWFTILVMVFFGGSCEAYKYHRFKTLMPNATFVDFVLFGGR